MNSSALNISPATPRQQLLGAILPSGWHLYQMLPQPPGSSGGNFGTGYIASKDGQIAFVKAVDFVQALGATDPMLELAKLVSESNFEKDVLEYCSAHGMTRVLHFIGHEYVFVGDPSNLLNRVSCLIMEAGHDDLRRLVNKSSTISCSWSLFVLRDVAKAIAQLHKGGIAHQDVKPSNIIAVKHEGNVALIRNTPMKIGDLGRVVRRNMRGPFDAYDWPGDRRYSPPERWYGYVPRDWNDARESADAYMLGSLIVYLFTGTPIQTILWPRIPDAFKAGNWGGAYDEDLLAVLVNSTAQVLQDCLRPSLMPELADEIVEVTRILTNPDPLKRGDPRARRQLGRPVGIDRIYQKLEALSARCAAIERGRVTQ